MMHSVSHDILSNLSLSFSIGNILPEKLILEPVNHALFDQMQGALKETKDYATKLLHAPLLSDNAYTNDSTDLNQILEDTCRRYQKAINDKKLTLNIVPIPYGKLPSYVALQLFENLMSNTLRHGCKGDLPKLNIYAEKLDYKHFNLIWEDNGPGFPVDFINTSNINHNDAPRKGIVLLQQVLLDYDVRIQFTDSPTGGARVVVTIPNNE